MPQERPMSPTPTAPDEPFALRWLQQPILPVVVVDEVAQGLDVAAGLEEGGLNQIEITLRTPQSLRALEAVARQFPRMRVAVGTVRCAADLRAARDAGATLAISPGFTPALAAAAAAIDLPWVPGVATASEVMMAHEAGFRALKFFPAMAAGGPAALGGIASALQDLRFVPTGGVRVDALAPWKALPCVAAVGGTWLTTAHEPGAAGRATLAARSRAALAAWAAA
jgi:2-dehydro-3-deoxyphosphogluconate aldolase/(4S)-4-hydroxy-2-oxoglutarate aldolase